MGIPNTRNIKGEMIFDATRIIWAAEEQEKGGTWEQAAEKVITLLSKGKEGCEQLIKTIEKYAGTEGLLKNPEGKSAGGWILSPYCNTTLRRLSAFTKKGYQKTANIKYDAQTFREVLAEQESRIKNTEIRFGPEGSSVVNWHEYVEKNGSAAKAEEKLTAELGFPVSLSVLPSYDTASHKIREEKFLGASITVNRQPTPCVIIKKINPGKKENC